MGNVAVIGAQWGDEGKGKIVDWLSSRADIVVRFQGGHNAGHTLVINGKTYKLSLLPSGIVRGGKLSVIGNGVVVGPWALIVQIDEQLDDKENPLTAAQASALRSEVRELIGPNQIGSEFQRNYHWALQESPDAVIAHSATVRALNP